jgi:dTDP-4-amino-4,6-dideoxygalactose transaminase
MLTPEAARAVLARSRCELVIPVAALGRPQPAQAWDRLVQETGVPVLIDAAPAFGSQAVGKHTSVAFSFHATKPFGIGEGGALASMDEALVERCRQMSDFGLVGGVIRAPGCNAKLSEYHSAVGLAQFERWAGVRQRRTAVWRRYQAGLSPLAGDVTLQANSDGPPALLGVTLRRHVAETVAAHLRRDGIETRRWYLPPLHHHPHFARLPRINADGGFELPTCEKLATAALGLPFHTHLSPAQIDRVCAALGVALGYEAVRSDA